jgi:uncharacterized membrane protein
VGRDAKGVLSMVIYAVAIPLTILSRWIAVSLYVVVAIMWLVPDRRVQSLLEQRSAQAGNAA